MGLKVSHLWSRKSGVGFLDDVVDSLRQLRRRRGIVDSTPIFLPTFSPSEDEAPGRSLFLAGGTLDPGWGQLRTPDRQVPVTDPRTKVHSGLLQSLGSTLHREDWTSSGRPSSLYHGPGPRKPPGRRNPVLRTRLSSDTDHTEETTEENYPVGTGEQSPVTWWGPRRDTQVPPQPRHDPFEWSRRSVPTPTGGSGGPLPDTLVAGRGRRPMGLTSRPNPTGNGGGTETSRTPVDLSGVYPTLG